MNRTFLSGSKSGKYFSATIGNLLLPVLLLAMLFPDAAIAQGNLLITPRRVVFEGSKKIQELNLANIGKDSARYVFSLVEIRMKEDGSFERIAEPDSGQLFASPYLRFFPRSVILAPNESQLMKVQLSRTEQLPPGEYRSHIYFRAERDDKPLGEFEARVDSGSISVSIIPIFGITIPIIVRVGELSAEVAISDVKIMKHDSIYSTSMVLNRKGTKSVYGDVKVEHVSDAGIKTTIGRANGVSVYTPNAKRNFEMKLKDADKVDLKKGKLLISYNSDSDVNPVKMTEVEVLIDFSASK